MVTQFIDFTISASGAGNLLGFFGVNSQVRSLYYLLRKHKTLIVDDNDDDDEKTGTSIKTFLLKSNILQKWAHLKTVATNCATQEDVCKIEQASLNLLFHSNQHFLQAYQHTKAVMERDYTEEWKVTVNVLHEVINTGSYNAYDRLEGLKFNASFDELVCFLYDGIRLNGGIMKTARTSYGKHAETNFIRIFNEVSDVPILFCQQSGLKEIGSINGHVWALDGIIDGFQNDDIVEIKHRSKKLSEDIPAHDYLQLHCYMYVFGKKSSKLFQCVKTSEGFISHSSTVLFCNEYWQDIMQRFEKLIDFASKLITNDLAWDTFSSCDARNKKKILEKYIGKPILSKCV
jgi:hypothetical protein